MILTDPLLTARAKALSSVAPIEDPKQCARFGNCVTDSLLTAREGAALIQVSVPTFWRWVSKRILPKPVKLGGMSRWPQSELLAVVERAKADRTNA